MEVKRIQEENKGKKIKSLNSYYAEKLHSLNRRWQLAKTKKERIDLYRLQIKIQEWQNNLIRKMR